MSLAIILNEINNWDALFGKPKIDPAKLTAADAKRIFDKIDAGLSPENLHCDGEASPAHVKRQLKIYKDAVRDLIRKGFRPAQTYCIPQEWLK